MLCKKPFVKKGAKFGCGQCMFCRFNRRRIWTHRLMLEALVHTKASFLTLTYDDENLPPGGQLVKRDLQLFIKRLRKAYGQLRYFAVGEYGDLSLRPHYHAALYGLDREDMEVVETAWGKGRVSLDDLTVQSAAYICGYVVKKLNKETDEISVPEFAIMSLKPGIGAHSVSAIVDAISTREINVPTQLRHADKCFPLGRYMRTKIREAIDYEETDTSREEARVQVAEMLSLYNRYAADEESPLSFRAFHEYKEDAKRTKIELRQRFYGKRGKI
uniref:Putative replication protein VP4 n=1 Tax=uncultured virus TaxID=340016 RepID=A0A1D8MK92_9VIRU|nr:putative replication protein VP4 [uncultured virus]